MSSSYTSSYPETPFNPAYAQFFSSFYRISDTPDAHSQYVDQFTPDATLIMASKRCEGSDAILALRKGMWEKVKSRKHTPTKIFPFGPNSHEVMIFGTVDYVMKEGDRNVSVDWAARACLVQEGEVVRMGFYQVYLVGDFLLCCFWAKSIRKLLTGIPLGYGCSSSKVKQCSDYYLPSTLEKSVPINISFSTPPIA
jgi:hypothetical protein